MPPTNAEYAKINIACKQLGLNKYELLADRYGLKSSTKLTKSQTFDLLRHFGALGWRAKHGTKGKSNTSPKYKDPQRRKVVACWITMWQKNIIRNRSNSALQKYVKKMTGKDDLRWCDGSDLNLLIEGLKQWAAREGIELV